MKMIDKAIKADKALRQLRDETVNSGPMSGKVVSAISDYLANATDESKARLYDIVTSA